MRQTDKKGRKEQGEREGNVAISTGTLNGVLLAADLIWICHGGKLYPS